MPRKKAPVQHIPACIEWGRDNDGFFCVCDVWGDALDAAIEAVKGMRKGTHPDIAHVIVSDVTDEIKMLKRGAK